MKRLMFVAAVAATFAAPSAFANSSAFATLGPISVTLYDLNPLDNISASITFDVGSQSNAYTYSYLSNPYDYPYQYSFGSGPWDPVSAASSTSHSAGTASLTGSTSGSPAGAVLSASSSSTNPVSAIPWDNAYNQSAVSGANTFTLSANTLVVFSAAASVSGSVQSNAAFNGDPTLYGDFASASVHFIVFGAGPSGSGGIQSVDDTIYQGISAYGGDPTIYTFSQSKTVGASFLNLTSGNLAGNLEVNARTYAFSYAAAVPEPETYAMLLAGLGLMGAMARRKQKKS